jgi:hypothetical protein
MNARFSRGLVLMSAIVVSASASAQDPRVMPKLDAPSAAAFRTLRDTAAKLGLPESVLWDKYYQGQAAGADGPRIVAAIRQLVIDLSEAQRQLGSTASSDELKAAASAVHAGVPAVELGKIKQQSGLRRSLALPFTVLGDIVKVGVPVSAATNAVKSMLGAGAKDNEINDFRRNVNDDIKQGASPAAAAETRAKSAEKPADKKPDDKN